MDSRGRISNIQHGISNIQGEQTGARMGGNSEDIGTELKNGGRFF